MVRDAAPRFADDMPSPQVLHGLLCGIRSDVKFHWKRHRAIPCWKVHFFWVQNFRMTIATPLRHQAFRAATYAARRRCCGAATRK